MRFLRSHHITKLVSLVDGILPPAPANPLGGRPVILRQNEVIALLVFSCLVSPQPTLKSIWRWAQTFYYRRFRLCSYPSWVRKCHQALPAMLQLLQHLLSSSAALRFLDSTMLHVCKLVRADRHRVARGIAAFGKNWQGWHFGFKLHLAVDHRGSICALRFTPANEHDAQQIPYLVNDATTIAVGDGTYNASVMRWKMWHRHRAYVLAPPHPKQRTKLATDWQLFLLRKRVKVECTFDFLKQHLLLETSFPRSVNGYAVHYIRVLLGYQVGWGFEI